MDKPTIQTELTIKTSRSSGSGGQHVNKVSTKVEIHFHVADSEGLNDEEKIRIQTKLAHRITNTGCIIVTAQATRSQLKNKKLAIEKLFQLLKEGLFVETVRKKRGISKTYKRQMLANKKIHSEKKNARKKINKYDYM